MNTTENNRLIGEFMGKKFEDPLNHMYDKDWNELMPVVREIRSKYTHNNLLNNLEPLNEYKELINKRIVSLKIQEVYLVVVEFIKWYNQEKK